MATEAHDITPDCDCAVCALLFPQDDCYYCGTRAHDSMSLTEDGVNYITRHYCIACIEQMQTEHAEMGSRIPEEKRAEWAARDSAMLAAMYGNLSDEEDEGDEGEEGDGSETD